MGAWRRARFKAATALVVAGVLGMGMLPADTSFAAGEKRAGRSSVGVPRAVRAAVDGREVAVTWKAPARRGQAVDRYEVRYRQSGNRQWSSPVSTAKRRVTLHDLTGGSRVAVEVRAFDGRRSGGWSRTAGALPLSVPSSIGGLSAAAGDRRLRLTWNEPARSGGRAIDRYEVMYRATGIGAWKHVDRSVERATLTSLRNDVPYSFRVRAHNALGFGPWTSVLRAAPSIPAAAALEPSAPAAAAPPTPIVLQPEAAEQSEAVVVQPPATPSVTTDAASATAPVPPGTVGEVSAVPGIASATLSWASPTAGGAVSGYEVRVRSVGSTSWEAPLQVSSASAEVSGLLNGREYEFSVRATGAALGDWSTSVRCTAGSPTAPGAPMTRFTSRALDVTTAWSSEGVELNGGQQIGWQVRYRAVGDSMWTTTNVDDAKVRQAALGTLPRGFQYEFAVRAVSEVGAGSWSSSSRTYVPQFSVPVMKIDTAASAPITSTEDYLQADYSLDTDDATAPGSSTSAAISGKTEIKGRGNSTWYAPKKPYRLKLAADASLLGMNASRHWVLLANAYDHSLLRNDTALYLGSKTGLAWTPATRYVEVLLNGDYVGLYQLAEQVRIDPKRIAIDSMGKKDVSGDELTGGYQLERDGRWNSSTDPGFLSSMSQPIAVKDPEKPQKAQSAYIEQYFDAFEAALQSDDRGDPDRGYAKYIDVDSFVDWYLVEEYTQNVDANFASVDLYKPRKGKLTMGPLWDFDLAFGNDGRLYGQSTEWYVKNGSWWPEFFKDPGWKARVTSRWRLLRAALPDVEAHVQATSSTIAAAAATDAERWGGYTDHDVQVDSVSRFLRNRAAWLDSQWTR